jgi:hypothetical protein
MGKNIEEVDEIKSYVANLSIYIYRIWSSIMDHIIYTFRLAMPDMIE